jgi:hypothetical protein
MHLLTIDFLDGHQALHSAVFVLPKNAAFEAQQQLAVSTSTAPLAEQNHSCIAKRMADLSTIKVESIKTAGEPVPAEYRALLYEKLLAGIREEKGFSEVYRSGDDGSTAAQCPNDTLTLTLNSFKKGNAAVRASTGPIGMFIDATSLNVHVLVRRFDGSILLDQDITASKRGDSDSLNIAEKITKSVTKKLTKANRKQTATA